MGNRLAEVERPGLAVTIYVLLFPLAYALVYYATALVPFIAVPIIGISYFLIGARAQFYPVLFLILFSRCLNGFIVPDNKVAYSVVNLLTGYLPILLYLLSVRRVNHKYIRWDYLFRHKVTVLYVVWLVLYCIFDWNASSEYFLPRVAPMIMILLAMLALPVDMNWSIVIRFFRVMAIVSLVLYFIPRYLGLSTDLFSSGAVFSVPVTRFSMTIQGVTRNMGIFFDFRILGLFSVVFLLAALVRRSYAFKWVDLILALALLASTLSRGAMVLCAGVLLGLILQWSRKKRAVVVGVLSAAILLSALVLPSVLDTRGTSFLRSLNVFSDETNALSQRAGFSEYALGEFVNQPLGRGVGSLKTADPGRVIDVGGTAYQQASDAFLAIQLAEIGVVGFLLFVGSLLELVWLRSRLGAVTVVTLLLLMVGTDVPDMGTYYFALIVMFILLIRKELGRSKLSKPGVLREG